MRDAAFCHLISDRLLQLKKPLIRKSAGCKSIGESLNNVAKGSISITIAA